MSADTRPLIFLVEDDEVIARQLIQTLREYGFDAHFEKTGSGLLKRLETAEPRLCIVDLGLPDMDGLEVVRVIRTKSRCGVLILTGRGHPVDRVMGLELGADDYVVKPFEPRELIARVRSILRRCAPEPAAAPTGSNRVAEFAGWRFEAATNRLTSPDGLEHDLSTAEALLLLGFLERPNRIQTREQLMGERDVSPFDRSIDVRISRLRRKLEPDPQNPKLIRTVYGAGYLLAATVNWR